MNAQDRFLCLMVLVGFGAFGWGDALVRCTVRRHGSEAPADEEDLGAPMKIAIGIALFLAVGGIAVAGDFAYFPELLTWQILGSVLGLVSIFWHRRSGTHPVARLRRLGFLVVAAFIGLSAFGAALTGPFNANDDAPAYVYLGQRLLATGGLIDPFNTRRVNSYGGAELFQALVLRMTGNATGLGIEWFFFALLLVLLVARTIRRPYLLLVLLVIGVGVVTVRPVGLWTNVAPTFSGAALTLALMQLMRGVRREGPVIGRFLIAGALLAGILSLRLEFFIPPALVLVVAPLALLRGRRALVALGAAGGAFVIAISGWAVALQRSSGTPLFPLFSGNWSSAAQWRNPAIHSLSGYLSRFVLGANQDHWDLAVGGSLLFACVLVFGGDRFTAFSPAGAERLRASCLVLGAAALGCVASLAFESVSLTGAVPTDLGRYSAPSTLACVAFCIDVLYEAATCAAQGTWAAAPSEVAPAEGATRRSARARWYVATCAAAGLALWCTVLGVPLSFYASSMKSQLQAGVRELTGEQKLRDHFRTEQVHYEKMNAMIPKGSYVLAAVEDPGLLDFKRFRFTTLDIVGGSSPPPHLPVFGGADKVVKYLRSLGIDGIVATPPRAQGLYNLPAAEANLKSSIYNYQDSARAVVAWAAILRQLGTEYHSGIKLTGSLEYIPITHQPQ